MLDILFQELIMLFYMTVVVPISAIPVTAYPYLEKFLEILK